MLKKVIFLLLLALAGLQSSAQLLSLEKPDNLIHISTKMENGSRDFGFSILSDFQCSVETWNTGCGLDNGKLITNIYYGIMPYHVVIFRNSDNKKLFDQWIYYSRVQLDDLKPDGYEVIVDDSNKPVPNNYTLFNAEVKASSSPVISIDAKYNENCGGGDGWIQAKAKEGVGPYSFKNLNTQEVNTSGKFSNLKAGTYTIQVSDANFCTDVESVLLLNIGTPVYSTVVQKTTCDSLKSLKPDTIKSGKSLLTGCDSFTITKYNFIPKFTKIILASPSCNPIDTGLHFVGKYQNQYGCDSLVWKHVVYAPKGVFTFATIKTVCISNMHRVDSIKGRTTYGCDSTHVISWLYEGVRTQLQNAKTSCFVKPNDTLAIKSHDGCDSVLMVTPYSVLPKDTIRLSKAFCMPRKADTIFLINRFGCDSIVITNYLLRRLDTTFLSFKTCNPALAGKKVFNLTTSNGLCDSIVVENWNLFQKFDTTRISVHVCGLKKAVHKELIFPNRFGCDSLVVIDSFIANSKTIQLPLTRTCDKSLSGNFADTLATIYGCDSIVKWSVAYVPPFRKVNLSYVCEKSQAGVFPHFFQNQYGCDSTVVDSMVYVGSAPTILADSTICGSKNSETILVQNLKNQYGCDSMVKQKLITFESPKLKVDDYSHPTSKWNGSIDLSVSKGKGPWILYDEKGNEIPFDQYNLKGGLYHAIVVDDNGCWDSLAVGLSDFWAYTMGRELHVHGGLADDELVNSYYGGEIGILEIIDSRGEILFTQQNVKMRDEFDFKFQISNSGVYYAKMSFPNQPGRYLFSKAVIQ